jgi:basic amino acid/polyamine antiporter, APA family
MNSREQNGISLKREIGLFTSTLLVTGLVLGSGVFKEIVPMSKDGLGELSILLVWLFAGLISLLGALSVGGLSSLTDESGGSYEYFRLSFGGLFAFISGWADFMIVGTGVSAALASFVGETVNYLTPLQNPLQSLEHIKIANFFTPFADFGIKIVGIGAIIILTILNFFGSRESGIINNIITSAKILGILILIIFGLSHLPTKSSEIIESTNTIISTNGNYLSIFLTAMLSALWAYDGWIYATNISGEIKNPKKNLPKALAFGILITTSIYILLNYVFVQIIPISDFRLMPETETGAIPVAQVLLGPYGKNIITVLIIICVIGALNSNIVSLPRKYYQMAHEGYFFSSAKTIHPRFRVPVNALIYSMVWSCILLMSGSFKMLSDMVVFTAFVFYASLCIALIKMKRNCTIKTRVFGYPLAPILFLLFSTIFLINTIWTEPQKSLIGLILILSSIPFYYYFRHTNKNKLPLTTD